AWFPDVFPGRRFFLRRPEFLFHSESGVFYLFPPYKRGIFLDFNARGVYNSNGTHCAPKPAWKEASHD
ncbi:MAG: hypothetical protein LUG15_01385, partial [Oscillospiraceae bacterium]|nr:hypothetical protein [Oscillospiraceae bacterium]